MFDIEREGLNASVALSLWLCVSLLHWAMFVLFIHIEEVLPEEFLFLTLTSSMTGRFSASAFFLFFSFSSLEELISPTISENGASFYSVFTYRVKCHSEACSKLLMEKQQCKRKYGTKKY